MNQKFKAYADSCIMLARTLVIKSEETAIGLNNELSSYGYTVDQSDKTTWKYYLHLSGKYHPTDKPIKIMSSDTQTEVVFDKPTMITHPFTLISNSPGGRFFNVLRRANPTLGILIKGVWSKVDINKAIAAPNFSILWHDPKYISPYEETLIPQIQGWINSFVERWFNPAFQYTDSLYLATFLHTLYVHLPTAIMTLRMENIKTSMVDEFHLWNYLAQHYDIDKYKEYLTREQALFLYKNIDYLRANAGKEGSLTTLIDNLITPKGLVVDRYDFNPDDTTKLLTGISKSSFVKTPYEKTDTNTDSNSIITPEQLLSITRTYRPDNHTEFENDVYELHKAGEVTVYNELPTSLLKVNENIVSNIISESSNQLRMDYWILLNHLGLYNPDVTFTLPDTNFQIYTTAKDALILTVFALNMSMGIEPEIIPVLNVKNIIPFTYVDKAELLKITDRVEVTAADVDMVYEDLLAIVPLADIDQLNLFVEKVKNQRTRHQLLVNSKNSSLGRSIYQDLVNGLYQYLDCTLDPNPTRTFDDWFTDKQFTKYDYSEYQWSELATTVMRAAAGIIINETDLPQHKAAMVEIVDRLTSYGLIIAQGDGQSDYRSLVWVDTLIDDLTGSSTDNAVLDYGIDIREDTESDVEETLGFEIESANITLEKDGPELFKMDLEYGLRFELSNKQAESGFIDLGFSKIGAINIVVLED